MAWKHSLQNKGEKEKKKERGLVHSHATGLINN